MNNLLPTNSAAAGRSFVIGLFAHGWLRVASRLAVLALLLTGLSTVGRAQCFNSIYSLSVGDSPASLAVGDFFGDNKPDLAVTINSGTRILPNTNGSIGIGGTYSSGTDIPRSVVTADFNKDGRPDLATANPNNNTISVFLANGSTITTILGNIPGSLAVGDFNKDGNPDLVMVGYTVVLSTSLQSGLTVLIGQGNGSFVQSSSNPALSANETFFLTVGDVNKDGNLDVVTANGFGTFGSGSDNVSVLLGTGTGDFNAGTNFSAGIGIRSVAIGDVNNDGNPDLVVATRGSNQIPGQPIPPATPAKVSILLGNGTGNFGLTGDVTVGNNPTSVVLGDFNSDNKLDLATANSSSNTVSVRLGNGFGGFSGFSDFNVGSNPNSIVAADFNGDGAIDLATANSSNTVSVLRNCTIPPNTAPTVANAIPPQSATVGQAFSYVIPANTFADAETPNALVLSASNLPAGLSLSGTSISGTPSVSGVSTATITATDPGGLTVNTTFALTVSPVGTTPNPGTFAITGITAVNCQVLSAGQRSIIFAPQYAGTNGQPITFQAVNESAPTTNPGPYSLNLYTDNPVITLQAVQSGVVSTFSYNWLAACNGPSPANTPPTVLNPIPGQAGTVGSAFSYVIPANTFTDAQTPNALVLSASNLPAGLSLSGTSISGTPSVSGVSTATITATDPGGLSVNTLVVFSVAAGSGGPGPSGFAITGVTTVSCQVLSAGQRSVTFTPQYAGTNGQPITFQAVNESVPTTNPGPYTLSLYTDNPTVTLKAAQQGTAGEVSFSYNWLAACGSGARVGGSEPATGLQVRVLGNPIRNGQVKLEVQGADRQPLTLSLTDLQGQIIDRYQVEQAGTIETHQFDVNRRPGGILLLRVNTPTQAQTVRLVKAD